MILVNEQMWREQFRIAASEIPMHVNTASICPPRTIMPASSHTFVRNYSQVKTDQFESFRKGTILTVEFLIRQTLPKAPTLLQFQHLLSFVGTWLGLSPWGSKFGFGRFELIDATDPEQTTSQNNVKNFEVVSTTVGAAKVAQEPVG